MTKLYSVATIMEHRVEGASPESVYEQSIYLVSAETEAKARDLGEQLARASEFTSCNSSGQPIRVMFDCILSTFELIAEPTCGVEIFSQFLTADELASMKKQIKLG